MFKYSTVVSVMALAAVSAPYVCQAQDPAGKFKVISQKAAAGKTDEALKMCDEMLAYFGKKSRAAQQYSFYEPFFVWKKGEILRGAKRYDEAYKVYKQLSENEVYQDDAKRKRAKERKLNNGEGYDPYLTASIYFMGMCKYQQGVGDAKSKLEPNPAAFEEAIPALESYLAIYEKGKISKLEKALKLDGQICFMLMQSYILKPKADFKTAAKYLEKGKTCKGALPDDMAMAGLATVINVAMKNPEAISWVRDIIVNNPQSYSLGPVRMARHGTAFFNPANNCQKMFKENLVKGTDKQALKQANDSARSAMALLGMVPNMDETIAALQQMGSVLGEGKVTVTDNGGAKYNSDNCRKLVSNYEKLIKDNSQLDAFATQIAASIAYEYGSQRLARGGFHILCDRYPNLKQKGKDGSAKELGESFRQSYAQLCRATGDEETALAIEAKLDKSKIGEDGALSLAINRMVQAQKEKRWEDVITHCQEIAANPKLDKASANYAQIMSSQLSALFALKKYTDVITLGESILADNVYANAQGLPPEKKTMADRVLRYQMASSCYSLILAKDAKSTEYTTKLLSILENYEKQYKDADPTDNLLPHMYSFALNAVLRRPSADEAALAANMTDGKKYCEDFLAHKFTENGQDHALTATMYTVWANLVFNLKEKDNFDKAFKYLQKACEVALKRPDGAGKLNAAEALNKIAINWQNYQVAEKTPEAKKAREALRDQSYADFWEKVDKDMETNRYALQMCRLELGTVKGFAKSADNNLKKRYDDAVARTRTIIARESAVAHKAGKINPDVPETIAHLLAASQDKLSEIATMQKAIPADDLFTQAALDIEKVNNENAKDAAKRQAEFVKLADKYEPAVIYNKGCYEVGSALLNERRYDKSMGYFDAAIERGGKDTDWNRLGKAKALAGSGNTAEADKLYDYLAEHGTDRKVLAEALYGKVEAAYKSRNWPLLLKYSEGYLKGASGTNEARNATMWRAEALENTGKIDEAITTYFNLYRSNVGKVSVSAPACRNMMRLLAARDKGGYEYAGNGVHKHGDKWTAWSRGDAYVNMLKGNFDKMSTEDKEAFQNVEADVNALKSDPKVKAETAAEAAQRAKFAK